jgi:hypothetical protein
MDHPSRITPRQAAYRDLFAIIAQLGGRSRRAQRALLEAELARALEQAHDFQRRCVELSVAVAALKDRVLGSEVEVAVAEGAARERVHGVRQEVFAVVEHCREFERRCSEFLAMTEDAAVVEDSRATPSHAAPSPDPVDDEAATERVPGTKPWPGGDAP